MPTNAIKKQLHLYFGSNGTLLDKQGDLSANAQDDETFVINAYIQDGVVDNQTTLINFTPQDTMAYTSDWFAMFYRELVSYVVPTESEPRVFAKFSIPIPSPILLVKSGKEQFTQRITIIQRYGNTHLGNFETLAQLNVDFPPTQTLDENNDVAFVYSNEQGQTNQVGFYQVEYIEGNHVWVKKESILYNLSTKQFNFLGLTVNVGFSNPRGVPTISESIIYQLMQELSYQSVKIDGIEDDLQITQNDIVNLQDQIDDMKNGTDAFTEVAIGVAPNVAKIRYIHTNGNNYQVLQIEYPDGRKEEINETIPVNYRNESGVTLSSGRLLMTDGTSQGNQAVKGILFDPTSPNAYKILGVVTVDGVAVNQKSKATRFGIVHGIPTSEFASSGTAYAEGQYLWGVADGRLSNVAPTKPALRVQVGIIINLQGGNADVLVAPIIYQKISDASDTRIGITESGTMLVNGDILRYQTSTQTWANSNALVLVEIEINNIKNGMTIVKKAEQDKNGNDIVNTYETKVIVSGIDNRVTNLENANMVKSVSYQPMTHIITFTFYDNTTQSLDLPLESAIIGASYDNVTKDITFTLQNGSTLVVPLDDLVSGLASETWVTTNFIPKTSIVDNLTTDDATKVLSAKQGKELQDTKEALANKATDFTVVDDTKYPTTKAVSERLLNLPIQELENQSLIEVFEPYMIRYNTAIGIAGSPIITQITNGFRATVNTSAYRVGIVSSVITSNKYWLRLDYQSGGNYPNNSVSTRNGDTYVQDVTPTVYDTQLKTINMFFTASANANRLSIGRANTVGDYIDFYDGCFVNTTVLGLESLSTDRLDYWFNVYKALLVNEANAIFSMFEPKQQESWIRNIGREVENLKIESNFNPIDNIKIISHNGIGGNIGSPQNTILGLLDAYRLGYRAIEIDLQNTSDNEIVCFHDATLDATTNGSGTISSKTLSTLKTYDIDVPNVGVSGIKIPTLREYLDSIKMLNDMDLVVEIKSQMTNAGIEKMLDIFEEYNLRQSVTISALSLSPLLYAKGLTSESSKYRFVWIKSSAFTETEIDSFYDTFGYGNGLMIIHTALTQDFIDYTHSKGLYAGMYGTDVYQTIMDGQRMGLDFASSDTCVQNNLNRGQVILNKVPNGTTNPNLTISGATINQSVLELTMSIRYTGTAPTISLGNYNFIVPHNENEWGTIRMKVIAKNTNFSITQSSGTFEFIRCNLIVTNI